MTATERAIKWNLDHPERRREIVNDWAARNRQHIRDTGKKWRLENPGKHCAKEMRRRASKLKATPKWANLAKIQEIYINCPKGYHVDHIVPLKGLTVCGLHVEANLQYLPALDNIKKGNRF